MPGIVVRPRARIFHGHDWVYSSEVIKTFGDPNPGDVISIKDGRDRPLGAAIYNPNSQIIARRFSRRKQDLDLDFFTRRIEQALTYRTSVGIDPQLCRLFWSESDGIPGLIVDRYGKHFVVQTLTLALEQRQDLIIQALLDLFSPESIVIRNDSPIRKAEGLETDIRTAHGTVPELFEVTANEVKYQIDLLDGQKTGLYLDQLQAHAEIAKRCKGKRVLDCFANQGGFGLTAAKAGATSVTCIDISETATQATLENAKLNGVEDIIKAETHNAFHYLKNMTEEFDVIILDPPSFTKNKKTLKDALRGYKEIHLRALKHMSKGGILSTYCCSHHATREIFMTNLVEASVDAKKTLRLIENHSQRADHPILPAIPETEYLKGFTVEVIPSR